MTAAAKKSAMTALSTQWEGQVVNGSVGAATGYRWFISNNPTFASEMRCAWNASTASALGPNTNTNFCWGGSSAIRRLRRSSIALLRDFAKPMAIFDR